MHNRNRFKIGFFAANASSGHYPTLAHERWSGNWSDNLRLAQAADDAGIDFLLPLARWKGYGGATDFQGSTFETITWASGLLAATHRMTIFGTVHAALFPPLLAAKQIVTADHIGHGRFALNVVCGWNEGEFDMFGVTRGDHAERYRLGEEWLQVLERAWTRDDFDVDGEFFHLHGVREKPKPYGGQRPLIMNAGRSDEGRNFAVRHCDAWFTVGSWLDAGEDGVQKARQVVESAKAEAAARGNRLEVYTSAAVVCRPTRREAEEYHRHIVEEQADWGAVTGVLALRDGPGHADGSDSAQSVTSEQQRAFVRNYSGHAGIGSPDDVAAYIARMSRAGFVGCALSLINYLEELPFFAAEVLPRLERLGLRTPAEDLRS